MSAVSATARTPRREQVVETPMVREVARRGLAYLRAGLPLHLSGPAGVGKTTLAFHLAHQIGRPVVFIQGDEQMTSADLVRGGLSIRRSRVVDNYIRSVVRTADDYREQWVDGWLTAACRHGHTLVYDEFTRSRPETNNVLLSVLEERVLVAPGMHTDALPVHAEFRAILTSNPGEYAGVYKSPDALQDRLVTVRLDHPDVATEAAIVQSRSGLPEADCARIVALTRAVRQRARKGGTGPSLRAAVALAGVLKAADLPVDFSHSAVAGFCHDLLGAALPRAENLAALLGAATSPFPEDAAGEGG